MLLNLFAKLYFKQFQRDIQQWKKQPLEKQADILKIIIKQSANTIINQQYQVANSTSYKDFADSLPLVTYEDFKPYIDQALQHKPNILLPFPIKWFAKSSGTTADKSKFIPTSNHFLKQGHYKAAKHLISQYLLHNPHSKLFEGKNIIMGGSHSISKSHPHIRSGDISALLLQNASFIRNIYTAPPLKIAIMDNWNEKIKKMAAYTLTKNITSISGVPTWTIAFIQYLLETENKSTLGEIWPNFELYINGGVAYKPYIQTMQSLIGKPFKCLEVYNASEGFFAAQANPDDDEGLLLYTDHGTFYEFIDTSQYPNLTNAVPLEGVELNKNYALVVSNFSGLYRYIIGDTIKFTSLAPYKIVITGRLKQFINAVGEEIIVENTDNAITKAANILKISIVDYTVGPAFPTTKQKAYHEWIISTKTILNDNQKQEFAKCLDSILQEQNSDYEAKRLDNIGLTLPKVHFVDHLFFDKWLKSKQKLGGQHKVPRLANSRKYLDELVRLL